MHKNDTLNKDLDVSWGKWLNNPSYITYQKKINDCIVEKKYILPFIIEKLKSQLYRTQHEKVYYQICMEENLLNEAVQTLLMTKKDVTSLSKEIKAFLAKVEATNPSLLLPFYHQSVERLVMRKTRIHYEEAASFIKALKHIYYDLHEEDRYKLYITHLNSKYKTFRAFIQELKKIDA